jgi:hypothetical protein
VLALEGVEEGGAGVIKPGPAVPAQAHPLQHASATAGPGGGGQREKKEGGGRSGGKVRASLVGDGAVGGGQGGGASKSGDGTKKSDGSGGVAGGEGGGASDSTATAHAGAGAQEGVGKAEKGAKGGNSERRKSSKPDYAALKGPGVLPPYHALSRLPPCRQGARTRMYGCVLPAALIFVRDCMPRVPVVGLPPLHGWLASVQGVGSVLVGSVVGACSFESSVVFAPPPPKQASSQASGRKRFSSTSASRI